MEKNKKSTIILVVIISFLMLAIGFCGGMLLTKNNTIINNYEQNQEKNESEKVTEENKNEQDIENDDENNKNEQEVENNDNNKDSEKIHKNIFGAKLMNIEDAAIAKIDIGYGNSGALTTEIDKNGKRATIKLEVTELDGYPDNYKIYLNDEIFYDESSLMRSVDKMYVVDLDAADMYYDLVLFGDMASADYTYIIFKYNGTTFIPVTDRENSNFSLMGDNLYVDKAGLLVPQNNVYVNTNPVASDSYYLYKENKVYTISTDKFKGNLIEFKNVYFTTDLDNNTKIMSDHNGGGFGDVLEDYNIYFYETIKAYVVEDEEITSNLVKVKLEDGTIGYIFTPEGVWVG